MKRILATAAMAVMTAAYPVAAQRSTYFGVAAGASIPVGTFLNGISTGYNVAVSLGMTNKTSPMGFSVEAGFNEMGFGGGASQRIVSGLANLTYDLAGMSGSPTSGLYVIGGGGIYGFYFAGTDRYGTNFDNSGTQTNFGLNGGIGYRFPLTDMTAVLEARLHYVFTNNSNVGSVNYNQGNATYIPITFGIRF